jgi:adenine-specific DNA methylase
MSVGKSANPEKLSDLNPFAVLINKAMIKIPPKFAGKPPTRRPIKGNSSRPDNAQGQ